MTDLDEMRRVAARDLAAAKARLELINDMALLMSSMRARGFRPELKQVVDLDKDAGSDLVLSLTVDPKDLTLPGLAVSKAVMFDFPPRPERACTPDVMDSDVPAEADAPQTEIAIEGGEEPDPETTEPEQQAAPEAETPDPRRPWTEADDQAALSLDRKGWNVREIADATHRSWQAVAKRLKALKAASEPQAAPEPALEEPEAEEPEPAETPVAEQPATSSPSGPMLDLDALTVRERVIERRLQAAGYPEPFTPQSDLALVQALFIGDGLTLASERLSIDKAVLFARYKMLMPEPSVEDQPAVLSVLRQRVARAD